MLTEPIDPSDAGPDAARDRYLDTLAEALDRVGRDELLDTTGVDPIGLDAIEARDADAISLADAATILAIDTGDDPDALLAEARETVLLEMSTAVVDVDTLAADLDGDLGPREIQATVEGRHPMSLAQYAQIRYRLADGR